MQWELDVLMLSLFYLVQYRHNCPSCGVVMDRTEEIELIGLNAKGSHGGSIISQQFVDLIDNQKAALATENPLFRH